MNNQGTKTALVKRVRTFADDVRRAQERDSGSPSAPQENTAVLQSKVVAVPPLVTVASHSPVTPAASTPLPKPPPRSDTRQIPKNIVPSKPVSAVPYLDPSETSHLSDDKKLLDIRQEAGGASQESTIIKDMKRKRWTLRKALSESFSTWIAEQKKTIAETTGRNLEPKVPPPQTREKVIHAARQKSTIAPKDDRRVIIEKLRTFARDTERATGQPYSLLHKPNLDQTPPIWSSSASPEAVVNLEMIPPAQNAAKAALSAIKQARQTIRPPETPSPIRTNATPSQPAKSLVKDVAPRAERSLPEKTFIQTEKEGVRPPLPHTPISYGVADVAPVVIREREMQASAKNTHTAPKNVPARFTPIVYGTADIAPVVNRAPEIQEQNLLEPEAAPQPDQKALDARAAAIEQLLAARTKYGEREVPATPIPPSAPSRDIEFEPPTFATEKTTNFRTYRNDAIHDVAENKRSIPNIAAAEAVRRTTTSRSVPKPSSEFSARPFVIAGIVMIVIIAIGGIGFFWYARNSADENPIIATVPTFMSIDAQKAVPFSTNRAALLETLDTEVRAAQTGITQIYPTSMSVENSETVAPAVTTSEFMYVLDPRAPGSFIRNLSEEMMFGSYTGAYPFFIFKTKQFDTAFAGMLDWEAYMSADLAPLFGEPVMRTRDATLRTVDQTRSAYFIDDTLRNVDVRILYDEEGKERILYAFLSKNTIVITTSSAALIALIERLQ